MVDKTTKIYTENGDLELAHKQNDCALFEISIKDSDYGEGRAGVFFTKEELTELRDSITTALFNAEKEKI